MNTDWRGGGKNIRRNVLLGLAAAGLFSFLYAVGVLDPLEERVYDFFLRFRAKRERIDNVVFLDVDDSAIAYNGYFPWPRSITADGLLRLKEYGARAAIFDIEYIDKGPQGVDSIYLNQGLSYDFTRSFSEIASVTNDVLSAFKSGRISRTEIDSYEQELQNFIGDERDNLFVKAQGVARDNDLFLAQASALFGKSWVSLNLRSEPLTGEQAERRPMAEEQFSHNVNALPFANGGKFVDILPPLPVFAQTGKGAGFTNVEIDGDGIRRRIYLTQKIQDHWYYQLAFAPLMDYLGNPEVELGRRKMSIKGARFPDGEKNITIPLDDKSRMMLDWPPEDYPDSFRHISFADFSLLEDLEAELEQYSRALLSADFFFFSRYDSSLAHIPFIAREISDLYDAVSEAKAAALEHCSENSFDGYTGFRAQSRELIREILDLDPKTRVIEIASQLAQQQFSYSGAILDEAEYIASLIECLELDLDRYDEISGILEKEVKDSFCILGRVDTGTTDIGVNPFWGEYVNVGTHAVVLDTILSGTFITPLGLMWRVLFAIILVPLFFLFTFNLAPVLRAALGFAGALLILVISVLLFRFTGIFFGPLGIVLAMISAAIVREIVSYASSDKEKRFYRKAFATYTSEAVANEIAKNPTLLQLGGTKRLMSAIFTDVQGFSTISEKLSAEDLVSLLNRYLTAMSNVILEEQGTIDKYEGDAIIAFFGAPLEQPDHALRSCISAVKIKRAEVELNAVIHEHKLSPSPLHTRIGINSGDMVAGNMGTDKKMNYTIMGDAVNLAARLEGVNKQYGTWILASQDSILQTGDRILARRLSRVRVVGKLEPVRLYNVLDIKEEAPAELIKMVDIFHEALDCFEKRQWKRAAEGFNEIASLEEKGPAQIYLKLCKEYLANEPADNWDGVYNLTEK
jgi:adenylate cyclase